MKPRKPSVRRKVQSNARGQDFESGVMQGRNVALHAIGPEIWSKAFRRGAVLGAAVGAAAGYVLGLWA